MVTVRVIDRPSVLSYENPENENKTNRLFSTTSGL